MKPLPGINARATLVGPVAVGNSAERGAGSGAGKINAEAKPPRLLDQVRARMRRLGLAIRSEKADVGWIRRFILASGKRHPQELGAPEVEAFLPDLAVRGQVAASTQHQALSALLFLHREAALAVPVGG